MAFIAGVGYYINNSSKIESKIQLPQPSGSQKTVLIGENLIKVEVADDDESRKRGLSGRTALDADSGMLFIFDKKDVSPIFWMKDTLIPLDIIWIDDGKIIKIDKADVPVPGTTDDSLVRYTAGQPIDNVLEVNAGFSQKYGIKTGDSVDLSKI